MKKTKGPWVEIKGEGIYLKPFEAGVIEGYKQPPNYPNCCDPHKSIARNIDNWLEKYPNCCDYHEEMSQQWWYKPDDFKDLRGKILTNLSYTEHHIEKRLHTDTWYEDIKAYIEYILESFGRPGIGSGKYLQILEEILKIENFGTFDFPKQKREKLLQYIKEEHNYSDKPKVNTDLNLLFETYQKWQSTFPNLPYFQQIKQSEGKFPMNLVLENPAHNPYMGITKARVRSNQEFIDFLVSLTKKVLAGINTSELIKEGIISNANSYKFELLKATHEANQNELLGKYSEDESQYATIVHQWLKNEKVFFLEIEPLIGKVPQLSKAKDTPSKVKDISWDELFKSNDQRLQHFFSLLKQPALDALDENNTWIYHRRRTSIVACFAALEDLNFIKKISGASLQRIVSQRINFKGSEKLFRLHYNQDDYDHFYKIFEANLS